MLAKLDKALVILFLALCGSLQAVPSIIEPINPASAAINTQVCNLPPPSFFSMIQAGPTWIKLSWSPVASAAAYHIITKEVVTGNVVDNRIVPASITSLVVDTLTPNTAYESRIWSVCANGQDGSNSNVALSRTIIIDVVIGGYPAPSECMMEECELVDTTSGCSFLWASNAQTYFKIRKATSGPERYFMITTVDNRVKLYPDENENSDINFLGVDSSFVKMYCAGYSGPIARVVATRNPFTGSGELLRHTTAENHQDFLVFRLVPCSSQGRSENQPPTTPVAFITATPNPFTEQLEVQVLFPVKSEQVLLRLFDRQGREVVVRQLPGGLEKHSLPTAELPPGFYFLRAESAGQTQTIKVVKMH